MSTVPKPPGAPTDALCGWMILPESMLEISLAAANRAEPARNAAPRRGRRAPDSTLTPVSAPPARPRRRTAP